MCDAFKLASWQAKVSIAALSQCSFDFPERPLLIPPPGLPLFLELFVVVVIVVGVRFNGEPPPSSMLNGRSVSGMIDLLVDCCLCCIVVLLLLLGGPRRDDDKRNNRG